MRVVTIPVRSDNYTYLLIDPKTNTAAAIDVYDVPKTLKAATENKVDIVSVLTTHHHQDHAGGNSEIKRALPSIPIYGGSAKVQSVSDIIQDGDELKIGEYVHVRCMSTKCHTKDSICYYATNVEDASMHAVFTGDTLFQGGCGRFFEGTPSEMREALTYLGTLPDSTLTYTGHEYTRDNLKFALQVDAKNEALEKLKALCEHDITAGKSTIGDEKEWNVFMRLETDAIQASTGETEPVKVMQRLREMKNAM